VACKLSLVTSLILDIIQMAFMFSGTFSYDLAKFRLPFCGSLLLPDSGQVQLVACIDLLQHNMPIAV